MPREVPAALVPKHLRVLQNAAGIRGVLKQAEHLQNQLRPLLAVRVTTHKRRASWSNVQHAMILFDN